MASFLKKLKKYLEQAKKPKKNLGYEDHLLNFKLALEANISVRLEAMKIWLTTTDERITKIFDQYKHESVAEQDAFSRALEQRILAQINYWIVQEDGFQVSYKELVDAYRPILKSTDMLQTLENLFNSDFKDQ